MIDIVEGSEEHARALAEQRVFHDTICDLRGASNHLPREAGLIGEFVSDTAIVELKITDAELAIAAAQEAVEAAVDALVIQMMSERQCPEHE